MNIIELLYILLFYCFLYEFFLYVNFCKDLDKSSRQYELRTLESNRSISEYEREVKHCHKEIISDIISIEKTAVSVLVLAPIFLVLDLLNDRTLFIEKRLYNNNIFCL